MFRLGKCTAEASNNTVPGDPTIPCSDYNCNTSAGDDIYIREYGLRQDIQRIPMEFDFPFDSLPTTALPDQWSEFILPPAALPQPVISDGHLVGSYNLTRYSPGNIKDDTETLFSGFNVITNPEITIENFTNSFFTNNIVSTHLVELKTGHLAYEPFYTTPNIYHAFSLSDALIFPIFVSRLNSGNVLVWARNVWANSFGTPTAAVQYKSLSYFCYLHSVALDETFDIKIIERYPPESIDIGSVTGKKIKIEILVDDVLICNAVAYTVNYPAGQFGARNFINLHGQVKKCHRFLGINSLGLVNGNSSNRVRSALDNVSVQTI